MNIIITGPTGMVGAECIREAIKDPLIKKIYAISRKPLEIKDAKLHEILHKDFLNYEGLDTFIKGADACLWCLGISQNKVDEDTYNRITYDYTIAAAHAVRSNNPSMKFIFVSGEGADPEMKSRFLFGRVKGKTENELNRIFSKNLFIVRPAGIQPMHPNKHAAWQEKIVYPFYPLFKIIIPNMVITSIQLAKTMLDIAKKGNTKSLLNNKELLKLAKSLY